MSVTELEQRPMQDLRTQLATLIASRICHDLISPVGAISNGLELVALGGALTEGPELSLISDSCDNANARIRFFRLAYGTSSEGALVSSAEVRNILAGLTKGGRVHVNWACAEDRARRDVQLAFLGLQCVETALRRGGNVVITLDGDKIVLEARAERVEPNPQLWHYLSSAPTGSGVLGEPLDISAAHVQFALLPILAAQANRPAKPHYTSADGVLTLTI